VQGAGVVNGDQTPLNLTVVGANDLRSPSSCPDAIDEKPEITRRRKAELMTSLRLADCSTSGRCAESPTPEVETSTDWNGDHLLYDPPPSKRRRADDDEDRKEEEEEEEKEKEEETESDDVMKKGRSSLFSVLAVCSFTDVYNAYQRRQARLQQEFNSSNVADSVSGSDLTAEVDDRAVDATLDAYRKSSMPTWDSCAPTEAELSNAAPPSDNGVYPLAARCVLHSRMSNENVLKFVNVSN